MILLGIETSCDETSVAILHDEEVLVNIISSQILHQKYGGVVPEFASREHMHLIDVLTRDALKQTNIDINKIDGIAATRGPGLMGALLVGLSYAKGLAYALKEPFLAVNHIEGHIIANLLTYPDLKYPFLCLLVSGGHTQIVHVRDFGDYEIVGRGIDDAAGEAFDKGARILKLGYPGGPLIDRIAKSGNPKFYHFPRAKVKRERFDFSFSGLKTSLLYLVNQKGNDWAAEHLSDLCASYQEAIIDVLKFNTFSVVEETQSSKLVLAGGVAANSQLRQIFSEEATKLGIEIYFPALQYCTDNAAMIARTGLEMLRHGQISDLKTSAIPNLSLVA